MTSKELYTLIKQYREETDYLKRQFIYKEIDVEINSIIDGIFYNFHIGDTLQHIHGVSYMNDWRSEIKTKLIIIIHNGTEKQITKQIKGFLFIVGKNYLADLFKRTRKYNNEKRVFIYDKGYYDDYGTE